MEIIILLMATLTVEIFKVQTAYFLSSCLMHMIIVFNPKINHCLSSLSATRVTTLFLKQLTNQFLK